MAQAAVIRVMDKLEIALLHPLTGRPDARSKVWRSRLASWLAAAHSGVTQPIRSTNRRAMPCSSGSAVPCCLVCRS